MKLAPTLMPLAAISTAFAFVVPDEELIKQMLIESQNEPAEVQPQPQTFLDRISGNIDAVWAGIEESFKDTVAFSENAFDNAINAAAEATENAKTTFECYHSMMKFDAKAWLDSSVREVDVFDHPDHEFPREGEDANKPPHGKHPHHPQAPNKTVYELIASSKYTTHLAKLINEYPDLVEMLNGTAANYTVFAPTDKAFEKLPKGHKKPSKELIKKVLSYHVSPDFYPAGRVLATHTIPTALGEDSLGGKPQRLRFGLGILKGLSINFYSRVVAINIFGTNGVIHAVDSLILPPPPALKIIELIPGEFSTLQLALIKTGLAETLADAPHVGGTLFAPSNWAFQKLGPRANAFLFSKYGEKYLKALLQYHVVANQTLYSDAFYQKSDPEDGEGRQEGIPKGFFHVDLPTLLGDKSLSVDVARYGGFISIKINGFANVAVQDGVAKDGVVQVVSSVLIPPKTPGALALEVEEEMGVEELKERLLPLVQEL